MENYSLKKPESIKKRKRVGTGPAAGGGKTCGRGHNGQLSRSGSKKRAWFEGGQMPLLRRVPKRGFNNIFKKDFQVINIAELEMVGLSEITPDVLKKRGLIGKADGLVKILANGELTRSVKVTADAFSNAATDKIQKAGGEVIIRKKEKVAE